MVVDSPERNAAFARRWHLPIPIQSDPGGEQYLRPLELWNAEERGGIAVPALLVISPDGEVAERVLSRDFADRIHDEDVLLALEEKGYPALESGAALVEATEAGDAEVEGAFRAEDFRMFFIGNMIATRALAQRISDPDGLEEIKAHGKMSSSFVRAWSERLKAVKAG